MAFLNPYDGAYAAFTKKKIWKNIFLPKNAFFAVFGLRKNSMHAQNSSSPDFWATSNHPILTKDGFSESLWWCLCAAYKKNRKNIFFFLKTEFFAIFGLEKIRCMLRIPVALIFGQLLIIQFAQTMAFPNPYDGAYAAFRKKKSESFFCAKSAFFVPFRLGKNSMHAQHSSCPYFWVYS